MLTPDLKTEILKALTQTVEIYKVILFGSAADGRAGKESDIDLIVVTDNASMPKNYREKMDNHLRVSAALREINAKVPIDLIVHTKPMHEAFIRLGSIFSKEIIRSGEVLYEKDN